MAINGDTVPFTVSVMKYRLLDGSMDALGRGPRTVDEAEPLIGFISMRICWVPEISLKVVSDLLKAFCALMTPSDQVGALAARMQLSRQAKYNKVALYVTEAKIINGIATPTNRKIIPAGNSARE